MADLKISQLTGATTPLAGTEVLPIVQSGSTRQVSVANLTAGRTQTSNGVVQGVAGTGYNFTANTPAAGMTSQLFNWYEEGTWTPVVKGGSTAGTYQLQANRSAYTRIGKRVFIDCDIQLASSITGGGSGYFLVDGLPFSASLNPIAGPVPVYHYGIAFTGDNTLAGTYTATTVLFGYYDAAGAQTIQDISAAAANGYIRFSLSYTV